MSRRPPAAGLELRPEWLQAAPGDTERLSTPAKMLRFAYERAQTLLALPPGERPDGWFVFSDELITGVLLALLENRVAVPDELKLVLYRNWEIDMVALPPCDMVGVSVAALAASLVDNIVDGFHGRKPKPSNVKYDCVNYKGDGGQR